MSKGNMLLGYARGKVGDLVFSRSNGQQVVRARATQVKNPKTRAQMIQRIIMATVAQAYSRMQSIVDHSFEGTPAGQRTMSLFLSKNAKQMRSLVASAVSAGTSMQRVYAFTPVGASTYSPNAYIISQGSLPSVPVTVNENTVDVAVAANTYQSVIETYGLQRGDQLTFVCMDSTFGEGTGADFVFARVILDPRNADGSEADLSSEFITNGAINLPSERNEGNFASIAFAEGKITFDLGATNRVVLGAAVIVSRKNADGVWMRSNATLTINQTNLEETADYYSLGECLDLLENDNIAGLSSRYLNNAGQGLLPSNSPAVPSQACEAWDAFGNGNYIVGLRADGVLPVVVLDGDPGQGGIILKTENNGSSYWVSTNNQPNLIRLLTACSNSGYRVQYITYSGVAETIDQVDEETAAEQLQEFFTPEPSVRP